MEELKIADFDDAMDALMEKLATIDRMVDLLSRGDDGNFTLTVNSESKVVIRIEQDNRHSMPHLQVDYNNERHAASYAIKSGELIVGTRNRLYDRAISTWIGEHRTKLLSVWNDLKHSRPNVRYVETLRKTSLF